MRPLLALCLLFSAILHGSDPEPGISLALARSRTARIQDLRYRLELELPELPDKPVPGRLEITARLKPGKRPLVLDFDAPDGAVKGVTLGGKAVAWRAVNGHLVLPAPTPGPLRLGIDFMAGSGPLNRQKDALYTLFVPARAHRAFPCFDQPDLKARYTLRLRMPEAWVALGNGVERSSQIEAGQRIVDFGETKPLPTYLFAFAAGRFHVESATRGGRTIRLFHREPDPERVARNRVAIFDLHAAALAWLEKYTAVPHPFEKLDCVVLPGFQFGGMEHPGAIYYRESSLFLEPTASGPEKMERASLIAHETAHLWFGDLVTMRWFNDVWMKEVFANFMADKIVAPSYPEFNHALAFLYAHYPTAYSVDRTRGSNPIRQQLLNLADAGSLYGPIIYSKAPIAMRNLELLVGEDALRQALRIYLTRHAYGNADWSDLIAILRRHTRENVAGWNRSWVEREGRPVIETRLQVQDGRIARLSFRQTDPLGRGLRWSQRLRVLVGDVKTPRAFEVTLQGTETEVPGVRGLPAPDLVLPVGQGLGYGLFVLDPRSLQTLLERLPELEDPLARGAAWVALWERYQEGGIAPETLLGLALKALPQEQDDLSLGWILDSMKEVFWRHLDAAGRATWSGPLETALRERLARAPHSGQKRTCFTALRDVTTTAEGLAWLERVWRKEVEVAGLPLSDRDLRRVAQTLALHGVPGGSSILAAQWARIAEPDEKSRFGFLMPALDPDGDVRRRFFEGLAQPAHRTRESWVLEGLRFLHHPLRQEASRPFVMPGLRMLDEVRRTGDIFFPSGWTRATLGTQSGEGVAADVRTVLAETPMPALRRNLVIALDGIERAARIRAHRPESSPSPTPLPGRQGRSGPVTGSNPPLAGPEGGAGRIDGVLAPGGG